MTLVLQAATSPVELKSRIVDASVFKSGLAMLTREVTVPAGDGEYALDTVPEALDGSFWYSSPDGLLVTDVTTSIRFTEQKLKMDAQSIGDYLAANVGHRVKFVIRVTPYPNTGPEKEETIEGTLNGVPRNVVPIKLDDGMLENINAGSIVRLDTKGLNQVMTRTIKVPELRVRFRAASDKPARLQFLSMEAGAAWIGNYLVKLDANGASQVVGKAQIGLGRLTFADTTVKALAGEPHLNESGRYDLAAGVGGLSAFLDHNQEQYLQFQPGDRDPYLLLQQYANEAAAARNAMDPNNRSQSYDYMAYGGFGGQGGGGMGGGFGGYAGPGAGAAQTDVAGRATVARALAPQANADRLESLYSYPLGKVNLKPGDRLSRVLFSQTSTYESIFRWDAEVGNDNSIVKSLLRIHNTGTVPWTGGPAFVTKVDTPLAQVDMPFTPAGKYADLDMANAQDILTKKDETEISRDAIAMPGHPKTILPRTTNEVHLTVESSRNETTKFELTLLVPGEVLDGNGGKVEKLTRKLDFLNGQARITWSFPLNAGDRREFRIQYRRLG